MATVLFPTLCLPNDLAYLPVVRAFVDSFCRMAKVEQKALDAIVLATNEAVSNVIRHAHQGRHDAELTITCMVHDGAVEVQVQDQGEPFQLQDVPVLSPCETRIGGRGVFLMRAILDELECIPMDAGGNVLRMVKRWSHSKCPSSGVTDCKA